MKNHLKHHLKRVHQKLSPIRTRLGLRGAIRLGFALLLYLFVLFVLLDAFVIPRNIVEWVQGEEGLNRGRYKARITENSYDDGNIKIKIRQERIDDTTLYIADVRLSDPKIRQERIDDTTLYIADVRLSDPSLLKAGLAEDSFGRNVAEVTSGIAERNGAVFAVNGDYYGYGEDLVIWEDGSFEVIHEDAYTAEELEEAGARQVFSFGPALVNNGRIQVIEGEEVERAQITNPRTAIGMIEPLHYIMVVSDGRTEESIGLPLDRLAEVMLEQGCTVAYNLDGGGSSTIWFLGKVLNKPTTYGDVFEERTISDILYVGY